MLFIGLTYLSTTGSVSAVTPGSVETGRGGSIYYGILSLPLNPYILPFDYGHFESNDVIHVREIAKEKLEDIAFIITPDNEFLYYYDYEAVDMSDYYYYQIYEKPSFNEVVEKTMEKYKNCFVLFARCW